MYLRPDLEKVSKLCEFYVDPLCVYKPDLVFCLNF